MKTWIKTLLLVLIVAGFGGGATYYFVNKRAATDKNSLQSQIDDLTKKLADATSGWRSYSSEVGFTVSYPDDWQPTFGENLAVGFVSPTTAALSPGNNDVDVYFYTNISDEQVSKDSGVVPKTLSDLAGTGLGRTKVGDTTLGGQPAISVITAGEKAYYTIFALNKGHLYSLMFNNASTEAELSPVDRDILDSFKFTN